MPERGCRLTIDEHRAAGTCSVCGGRMDTFRGGANRITADEYRHGECEPALAFPDPVETGRFICLPYPPTIGFRLLHPAARQPTRATPGSTGWDLYAAEPATVIWQKSEVIRTGIAVETPPGWAFAVRPRSGLSRKGIVAVFGTIDNDYRGEIGVQLHNLTYETYRVAPGDRIAQLVLEPVNDCRWEERERLGETARNQGGFGSSGV